MKVTKDTIEHVANLARLNFTDKEKEELILDMEKIISYVDKLDELETSYVEATQHVIQLKNVFREDKVEDYFKREKILKNAPEKKDGCFKVPKIVE
ncbi:Asp-tRNA(Asn)/Glu-tRNA(Gln) amidotransferase subunit GatC [Herbivorax sp. ANBcel31]|uniref:Asp-tRNA(Asn)/Glu-tRNA(Gln) amidotransferase subunit GatC n=1 Tax=Herbivorax sp. ANBcel31 TaxID=3069754 RepID=UPI0027B2B7D4|nr:Asp-tRNA(Asn)/Glu-tRNA(Gln) amidotransferase subunit GatC [Herbivorax sp. ANBcel31]MDQ2085947.1 Asp-tRNA(Asn)/Glu-tRNA(Gln) amidotransferase subunit GatC [Herbivorax sp. ANBcel31]